MAEGFQAGAAYVPVRPNLEGFQQTVGREITRALAGPARRAGTEAGRNISDGVRRETTRSSRQTGEETGRGISAGIRKAVARGNKAIGSAAKNAMAGVGIAAGAALGTALAGAVSADAARGKLQAQLGLTATESQRAGKIAGELYANAYGESMADVNAAITSVIQNMDGMRTASAADLKDTTAQAMTLAQILDADVGEVTRAVSQMLRTGLAKNAQDAFDILTRGAQLGGDKAQDLLDTFNEYGTQLRKLGLSGQTAMGLIQQGLQGGARDADIVADSLKEFSIRAIDGSKTTTAAFKDLGLNAGSMAKQIAAGGPSATKALDLVLDSLRKIEDPIKRNEIATNLFGTQWEDMGSALLQMDPSKAAAALGQVGGAADKAGQALGGTLASRFEAFKRSLMQDATAALMGVVGWMQKHETAAKVLAGVIGGLLAVYAGYNIALGVMAVKTAVVAAATAVWNGVQKAVRAATLAWTAVQWLLNAALTANPIGLVVVAVAALIAGVILAYKHSATFRNVVAAAWSGIKTAIAAAWAFIKPVFDALKWFVLVVLVGAFKAYVGYVKLAWSIVSTVISAAWGFLRPIFSAIATVIKTVLSIAFIVFQNLIKTVWIAIQIYIKVAWAVIKGVFNAIKTFVTGVLAPAFTWFYNNVIKPVWGGIKATISAVWAGIKVVFNAIRSFLSAVLGPAFRAFRSGVGLVWAGLKTTISTVWNSGIRPVFNALKSAVGAVRSAFSTAVNGIKSIWDRLKDIAKTPVNFVIGIYNNGVRALVNNIASVAGIKTRLNKIPTLARGGTLDNPMPVAPMMTNGPMAIVGEGRRQWPEFVIPTDPRYRSRAEQLWAAAGSHLGGERKWLTGSRALGGEGLAFARGGQIPALASGGVIGSFVSGLKNFAFGNVEKAARTVLGKILGGSVPGSGVFRDAIAAIPDWIKAKILGWIKSKVGDGAGGPGMGRGLNWAKTQAGKPYIWGGVGPNGYDCSGFMSALTNVIKGKSPYSRLFSTHSFGASSGPGGFVRNRRSGFMVGVTNAGVGHMAGTLLGKNVESSGSAGVRVGGGARGYNNPLFGYQYGLKYDQGGWLEPGVSTVVNATRRPEPVLTRAQFASMHAAATSGSGERVVNVMPDATVIVQDPVDVDTLSQRTAFLARSATF